MKKLVFNDSRWIEIQDATEAEGILHVRIILTTSEQLKAVFGDPFATQKMTCFDNQQQSAVYENYTILNYIKEYTGGIFEVEMIQENKDAETRLRALESKAKSQAEDIEQIKKDIEGGGTGVDQALITASVVVARANAQALPDVQALEAKVLYDTFDDLVKAKYTAEKQGFKFRDGDDLYKTAQDNVRSRHSTVRDREPKACTRTLTRLTRGHRRTRSRQKQTWSTSMGSTIRRGTQSISASVAA